MRNTGDGINIEKQDQNQIDNNSNHLILHPDIWTEVQILFLRQG